MAGIVPDRVILRMVQLGIDTIRAHPEELDDILGTDNPGGLEAAEVQKVKTAFAKNPPTVIQSYPRSDSPFPVIAVMLSSDTDNAEFLSETEQFYDEDEDLIEEEGEYRERRRNDTVTIRVYDTHPDLVSYYYRVLKRIIEAGTRYMIDRGLHLPKLTGQELMPTADRGAFDQLFVRGLSVSVEYHDIWPASGYLWDALNGAAEASASKVDHYHEDIAAFVDDDGDLFGQGKLGTFTEDD